jgi:hypothetical protein
MTALPTPALSNPYELVSVRAAAAPNGAAGTLWHRYEISQGVNRIVGYRQGGLDSVTVAVEAIVTQLNERRLHQRGRVHIALQPRSRSPQSSGR